MGFELEFEMIPEEMNEPLNNMRSLINQEESKQNSNQALFNDHVEW